MCSYGHVLKTQMMRQRLRIQRTLSEGQLKRYLLKYPKLCSETS